MMAVIEDHGFSLVHEATEADLVVVNTCAFIEEAQREALDEILGVAQLKETGRLRFLVVAGCLGERHGRQLMQELPEVDAVIGPGNLSGIGKLVESLLAGQRKLARLGVFEPPDQLRRRVRIGSPQTAYVKISEGCNHGCSFCLIPRLRGPQRSCAPEAVLQEVEGLAAEGVQEVILVAQDTSAYGCDFEASVGLADLLRQLVACNGPAWIRVMYTHPSFWTDALIDVFADGGPLLPYVDIPIQHISNRVLKAMGRSHDGDGTRALLEKLRQRIPGLVLRTTVMTGHPEEGPAEFEELLSLLREFPFDRLGAFAYSAEQGTRSALLEPQIGRAEAELRRRSVLELQRELAVRLHQERKGTTVELLIEGVQREKDYAVGRSYAEAPEVDGVIYVKAIGSTPQACVEPGDFLPARIIGAGPYDLVAVPDKEIHPRGSDLRMPH